MSTVFHRFVDDLNFNRNNKRDDFFKLNSTSGNPDNPYGWIYNNYPGIFNTPPVVITDLVNHTGEPDIQVEFNKMFENAKKIFPSLKKVKGKKHTDSKFAAHLLALIHDDDIEIENEDAIIL